MPKRGRATRWNYSQCVDLARIALRYLERSEKEERVQKVFFLNGQLVFGSPGRSYGGLVPSTGVGEGFSLLVIIF